MTDPVLIADIGGTNARFSLASIDGATISIHDIQSFRAEDFETIHDAVAAYLESAGEKPSHGCFAVAGPVGGEEITFTNSHWRFRPDEIEKALALKSFLVINDFYALAAGVEHLPDDAFETVKEAQGDSTAPILVIGPGTGLGQALIIPTKLESKIIATEGGHASFAPGTEEEIAVMQFISREHPRVSVERLLSGQGLVNIHCALCNINEVQNTPLQADEITAAAIDEIDLMAVKAVAMFCEILGRVTGDAVLGTGARGGVVLGGGILPRIKGLFFKSQFLDQFLDKGRMNKYMNAVPVRLIVKDGGALYGAAAAVRGSLQKQ